MTAFAKKYLSFAFIFAVTASLSGCVLAPREAKEEASRLDAAGDVYRAPFEKRELPELPNAPTWEDVLRRALLANGELEAAYFEWAMAVSQIEQAGSYPNTPLSLNFSYMFSGENMKAFDRTTVTAGPDPMENLALPTKVYQSGKVATAEAQAAGRRFVAAKFDLQRRVLNAWHDYALMGERARIAEGNLSLLKLISDTAAARVRAGAPQQELQRVEIEYRQAESELRDMQAQLPQMRAMLNAMLARSPDAPLPPPARVETRGAIEADDQTLLVLAAENNPELSAFAHQVRGRKDALERARMEYIPDLNPMAGFTGSVSQMVGLGLSIPTFLPKVRGMVKEARADQQRMEAMYRQAKLDRAAQLVAALYGVRNSERQAELFEQTIIPAAERIAENARHAYATGTGTFIDLIDVQRTLLDVRLTAVEARAAREKGLADLEALLGLDLETLSGRSSEPAATAPADGSREDGREKP